MTPCFDLKCEKCGFVLQDVIFPASRINWRSNRIVIKCEVCGEVGSWIRLPSVPNLKKDGTYSYDEKK